MAVAFTSPARILTECGNSYLVSKLQWRLDLTLFNHWEGILKSKYRFQFRADPNSSPQISFSFQGTLGHPAPFLWSFGSLSLLHITCISKYIRELLLSRSVVSNSFRPHGLQASRLLCPRDCPGKNTGVGCQFLLQGIRELGGAKINMKYMC